MDSSLLLYDGWHETAGKLEISIPESVKPAPNQTDNNQTEKSYIDPSIYPEEKDVMREKVKKQIEFDILTEQEDMNLVLEAAD